MIQFPHVEDYLEILAGYEPGNLLMFNSGKYKFQLARYDVQIVESMANAIVWENLALTERQGDLTVKLILKYRRQFASQGIDVTPVETPKWRHPLRSIDRTRAIELVDDYIVVRFPYDQNLINDMRKFKETSEGSVEYQRESKVWKIGITEYTVNFLVAWGKLNNFTVDPSLVNLFNKVIDCENQAYEIKLVKTDTGYTITNAAESLLEYVAEHIGNDFVRLVDYAGILGYTVDADLLVEANKYGSALEYIGTRRTVYLEPRHDLVDWVFKYAELTNRYPICIYDPNPLAVSRDLVDLSAFSEEEIVKFDQNGRTSSEYNPYTVKVVYAKKLPKTWEFPIPLLISTQQMMFGGRKLDWITRAERIIYFGQTQIREE